MRWISAVILMMTLAAACAQSPQDQPDSLTLLAHESFAGAVDESTFASFTEQTGIAVEVIAAGDAGSMVNQAVLTKDNPLADVLFGVDDTFVSRALDEEIFVDYRSPLLEDVLSDLDPDTELVTPVDFGDVCLNYDKAWFEQEQTPIPTDLDQLRDPAYAGLLTVEHPATSSPGLAFMLSTVAAYGEDGWLDFWSDLKAGGVNVAPDWNIAYYEDFSRYEGPTPLVVSYASSPPAEVIYATEPLTEAPTGVIEAGCYRQIEYAGILSGTEFPEAAGELIDFMLSVGFQETIPLTWFVFPANADAELPQEFIEHTIIPSHPARLAPRTVAENRDRWIDQWVAMMEG